MSDNKKITAVSISEKTISIPGETTDKKVVRKIFRVSDDSEKGYHYHLACIPEGGNDPDPDVMVKPLPSGYEDMFDLLAKAKEIKESKDTDKLDFVIDALVSMAERICNL